MTERKSVRVVATRRFSRQLKNYLKKYRALRLEIDALIGELQTGALPGDRLQRTASHVVYKVRLRNRDAAKGQSGGFRVIYFVQLADQVVLLTIYSKSDQTDEMPDQIETDIAEYLSEQGSEP